MQSEVIFVQEKTFLNGLFQILLPASIPFIPQIGSICNLSPQLLGKVIDVSHFEKSTNGGKAKVWETYVHLGFSTAFKDEAISTEFFMKYPEFKQAESIARKDMKIYYSGKDQVLRIDGKDIIIP